VADDAWRPSRSRLVSHSGELDIDFQPDGYRVELIERG
jgi:hypothetical protein